MGTHDIVQGVADWITAVTDPPVSSYAMAPSMKDQALPDVVVEVATHRMTIQDPLFPLRQLQQQWIRVWTVAASIMVENNVEATAAIALEDYADQLTAALQRDGSLSGNVPFASPFISFDFTAPFVEYPDGTRGREMTAVIHVGELVEAPE